MMLAIFIFMGAALAVAAYLVVSSMRTTREEERQLLLAQEREHTARLNAERARALRAKWEAKIAEDQRLAAAADPRGPGDGLGRDADGRVITRTRRPGRFRRDVPAPFTTAR